MKYFLICSLFLLLMACNPPPITPPTKKSQTMLPQDFQHNLVFDNEIDSPTIKGFQEVIFSVSDLEEAIALYEKVTGWKMVYRGQADKELPQFWQLPEEVEIEEALLQNIGDHEGFLRLVSFKNVEQQQIRSSGRPWDTGGIFDINLRAKDLQTSFEAFQEEGWNAFSDPIRYQFGKFDVEEVVMQGDDGIAIAMMQRHAPTLEGYPNLRVLSHVFNSTHISKDIDAAYHFFVNQLGFKVYMQTKGINRKAGRNVLGIPQNVNAEIELPVYIVHPEGVNFGSVEFIQLKGLEGEDFSELAIPPNLGILMLRFPVSDAVGYAQLLEEKGVKLHIPIHELEIAPYGKVKVFVVRSPDGVWLEFMELL